MGGPVEGWSPEAIREKFSDWDFTQFIPTQEWKPKGHGRITDDTLMVEALMRAYNRKGGHMDAYDFRDFLLPEVVDTVVWLPERQEHMPILDRMNAIEKFTWFRLCHFGAEPRTAGIGNAINCAIAMFIWPVGAINAGDPEAAYQEAVALGSAESYSYAVESAAVLAAAYSACFHREAKIETVLDIATSLAKDGTRAATLAVLSATDSRDDLHTFLSKVRAAFLPYDHKETHIPPELGGRMADANQPSSRVTIEEVPVALAVLKWCEGDFLRALQAGVSYGRDCDSIAAKVCGMVGALVGEDGIPLELRMSSNSANVRNWSATAKEFSKTILAVAARDAIRFKQRNSAMDLPV